MTHSTITSKGQTTIPAVVRERLGLRPGDRLVYEEADGGFVLRAHPGVDAVAGMLAGKLKKRSAGDFDAERRAAHTGWARRVTPERP